MKSIELLENLKTQEDFEENKVNGIFYRAYKTSNRVGLERINFDHLGFESDQNEVIENIERFGIEEFTISNDSTALMEALYNFKKHGYKIVDLTEIETGSVGWNFENHTEEKEIKPAIMMKRI